MANVAHPRGARSARGHLKGVLTLKNLAGYKVLNYYAEKSRISLCDTGVLVEQHKSQIYDTGVLVK